ncbi:uncharacterized protein LOC123513599 [Portunus trituberculatus]|uniref:uncharacterized protein LOC123513599 n=1 Tax=Portunus trituberculatus TaxID=210409 RepID=UPI001E1CD032|nr:uncharacterized protein LOC123513599 [Portunus trituberculatus]
MTRRLEKLVGGVRRGVGAIGKVAGEVAGAGVVAAGQTGYNLLQTVQESQSSPPSSPHTRTLATGLQLTVPQETHVNKHRVGVRLDILPHTPRRLIPPLALSLDLRTLSSPLPLSQKDPVPFLGGYTHDHTYYHHHPRRYHPRPPSHAHVHEGSEGKKEV